MTTKLLSQRALSIIDGYRNFAIGSTVCSIPYYNNKRLRARAKLRAQIGKGSPKDIFEEVENLAVKEKVNLQNIDSLSLKKFLVDRNIGIDCSGLVYHVLEPRHLSFPFATGFIGRLRAKIRPAENMGVASLAHEKNSKEIPLTQAEPGDIITMVDGTERDHILLIHQVDYEDLFPAVIHYTHSVAWPTDGEYGHGVRQGMIKITDMSKPITEQEWIENEKTGVENYTFMRATKSVTTLRRPLFL